MKIYEPNFKICLWLLLRRTLQGLVHYSALGVIKNNSFKLIHFSN